MRVSSYKALLPLILLAAIIGNAAAQYVLADAGHASFRFAGYLFFYEGKRIVRFHTAYNGLVKYPIILRDDRGVVYILVFNCTSQKYKIELFNVKRLDISNVIYYVFVYNTMCYLSYPLIYKVRGSVDVEGRTAIVNMSYELVFGNSTTIEGREATTPNTTSFEQFIASGPLVRYMVYSIEPALASVKRGSGTLRFRADPRNSTIIIDAPPEALRRQGEAPQGLRPEPKPRLHPQHPSGWGSGMRRGRPGLDGRR